ncbi:hypothetical protein [Sphingomonas lenta]|uniref:HEPN domain-containing protein n=1 Tax=Sphingomonas lenta TaxID=1141887 RepID=A0A2A2SFG3_9SPHN|nr:hypothetical protein [Sphingomonas lenta]PAX07945.1 hypothetical protein CKY28_10090 [Sphingomonas lenta]
MRPVSNAARDEYPGQTATPAQLCSLADEYRLAAKALAPLGRSGDPRSRSPFRLVALQAIELYLNAALIHYGHDAVLIRGLQHDMAKRAELVAAGLRLRRRTAGHLVQLGKRREYLLARYDPSSGTLLSEVNRVTATLDEVARKVATLLNQVRPSA